MRKPNIVIYGPEEDEDRQVVLCSRYEFEGMFFQIEMEFGEDENDQPLKTARRKAVPPEIAEDVTWVLESK